MHKKLKISHILLFTNMNKIVKIGLQILKTENKHFISCMNFLFEKEDNSMTTAENAILNKSKYIVIFISYCVGTDYIF